MSFRITFKLWYLPSFQTKAVRPQFQGVTYTTSNTISDATGGGVTVATLSFTDTDITSGEDDAINITMAPHNYFDFVDNGDGTG